MNCPADLRTGLAAGRPRTAPAPALTPALTMFFSATVGVIVLNLFAAQPLTGPIAAELRLPASLTGLVAMLPQLGYAAGLVLLVPLVDLLENRRLIVTTLAVCAATLALPAVTRSGAVYLAAVFAAGAASSVIQMLVPMAASMAPDERRGRAVGNVMSGLMLGILLSRPLASLIAGAAGWRAFYGAAAAADIAIAAVLAAKLPLRAPQLSTRYAALLRSLWTLVATERVLQRRALSAALSMAAFSAFWTAIGLRLAAAPFDLGLHGIAMFAFAGATGAIVTPFAGLAGDRGRERDALRGAHVAMLAALAALGVAGAGWGGFDAAAHPALALALLVAGAAALDAGVVADQTLGRRAINLLDPAMRGRLNGLFVGLFFVGGSLGAVLAGAAWAWAGWGAVCAVGLVFAGAAFALDWIGAHGPAPR
ncbi:MFS transporter [Burkholderia pseudomallei]|uniref:Major Facilitator Superfamily protein n=1 Tax=Burkholderia pseudomallei TaxID=28450 RepID=A0AA40JBD3_BURPE|nr:MFS transporter [Burkholderia pseudomallei]AIV59552.1 major Facilitator Superfamily protein [Burkholderia pseudomallei MSHR2243]AIV72870.1 major Facilitator Superfamily protein [Burkholderia pseudomallei MSHR62]KGU66623.1 major Facilitator Superfamily protein [Burkholderia pseudomallei MSHR465J]KGU71029.1 major Facilitator Superfamily protein [Burkholderia pseudomallei MSHR4304]KGV30325.1 major Facilitator Superfamily protein [Burkholderia pseudomallei MSHR4308]